MKHLSVWRLLPIVVFAVLLLLFWRGLSLDPKKLPSTLTGQKLPDFQLQVLGHPDRVFSAASMRGQVSLLNVWASWCASCVDEQVFLMSLAGQGVPIYGLNYKDDEKQALDWLNEWGNPYRMIGRDETGKVAIDLGVYGAPETFLIDAEGIIRFRQVGVLDDASWQRDFVPRMRQLQGGA